MRPLLILMALFAASEVAAQHRFAPSLLLEVTAVVRADVQRELEDTNPESVIYADRAVTFLRTAR